MQWKLLNMNKIHKEYNITNRSQLKEHSKQKFNLHTRYLIENSVFYEMMGQTSIHDFYFIYTAYDYKKKIEITIIKI